MRKSYLIAAVAALFFSCNLAHAQSEGYDKGVWFDVSVGTGDYASLPDAHTMYAGDFAVGYRFNPHVALGAGAGVALGIKSGAVNIPVFVKLRYDMLDRVATPFISLDLGYALTPSKQDISRPVGGASVSAPARYMVGPYDNLTVGCAIKVEKGHRIWFGVSGGYFMTGTMSEGVCRRDVDLLGGMIRLGYDF